MEYATLRWKISQNMCPYPSPCTWLLALALVVLPSCVRTAPETSLATLPNDPTPTKPTATQTTTPHPVDVGPSRAVNDRDFLPAALLAIQAAQERIRVAEYLLYDDGPIREIAISLADAEARGVRVQVLVDEAGNETQLVVNDLAAAGIETQFDSRQVTLHNKLIVADDVALVGSHNFTRSALEDNHEGTLLVNDAEVAGWYAHWYDAVWDNPASTPEATPWSRTDFVPLADRMITEALIDCMDRAVTEIDVLMYAVAWNEDYPGSDVDVVLTALESAHARGVQVTVVLDQSDWITDNAINEAAIARLSAGGIAIWNAPDQITTHAKVLRCDDTVVVSDANWSYSGLELMHGTSIQATNADLSAAYESWIADIRDTATPLEQ